MNAVQFQSVDERARNLQTAQHRRMAAAAIRREIASLPMDEGWQRVERILLNHDEVAGSLTLDRLIRSVHRVAESKAAAFVLTAREFNPTRRFVRVRDLTSRERAALVLAIRDRA